MTCMMDLHNLDELFLDGCFELSPDEADWLDGMTTPILDMQTPSEAPCFEPKSKESFCFNDNDDAMKENDFWGLWNDNNDDSSHMFAAWDDEPISPFEDVSMEETLVAPLVDPSSKKKRSREQQGKDNKRSKISRTVLFSDIQTDVPQKLRLQDTVTPLRKTLTVAPTIEPVAGVRMTKSLPRRTSSSDSDCSTASSMSNRWTQEQDEELINAVEKYNGQSWKAIASMVSGRDHVQCLQRWKKVLQPGLVKGMWTQEEDELLMQLKMESSLKDWPQIASHIPGRTAKQCRERWSLNLDPSISKEPWTKPEDDLLIKLQGEMGNKWAEIKRFLDGRTENAVKTRFKSLQRAMVKDTEVVWTKDLEEKLEAIAIKFDCNFDEVAKHLPRQLRGISSQAMRDHCPLLREHESRQLGLQLDN